MKGSFHELGAVLIAFASIGLGAVGVAQAPPATNVIKAHFTQKQQQTERYVYVPFEVARGTTRIDIDFRYQKTDLNVVDLGLLEPGGVELGTKAFRGWSGGERSSIFVSESDATPGYWPGPISPGTWRVALGLYKVGPNGVDVEVAVKASMDANTGLKPSLPSRPREPIARGERWYSGQLHAHTHNSDGALSVPVLAQKAKAEGLDFLALTDHNTTAQQREPVDVPGLLTIIGEEVTTPGGHMSAWGLGGERDLIDFRVAPGDPALQKLLDEVGARVLLGINHPYGDCVACGWTHDVSRSLSTIEVTSREPSEMVRAVALWDLRLRAGHRLTAVGVSDWHRGEAPLGAPSVRVKAPELSTHAILAAIRAGRVVVMTDAASAPPELMLRTGALSAAIGDTLTLAKGAAFTVEVRLPDAPIFAGARVDLFWNGERLAAGSATNGVFSIERFGASSGYYRAQVTSASGAPLALTNPVWVKVTNR